MHQFPASRQSQDIYKLLVKKSGLNAKGIGKELKILPNAVYRAIKPLRELGLVEQTSERPTKFIAKPSVEAVEMYLLNQRNVFEQILGDADLSTLPHSNAPVLIKDRNDLIEKTNRDVKNSKRSVDFIVSGLEVPAETLLTYKQALDRNVKIRSIVQRLDDTSEEMFRNWKKIGLDVRHYPSIESRIFVIDNHIVYLTSYDPERKEECVGIRTGYEPFAKLMREVFERKWESAKEI